MSVDPRFLSWSSFVIALVAVPSAIRGGALPDFHDE